MTSPWSNPRTRFRSVLAGSVCVQPATVFDSLSARLAAHLGLHVTIFPGSLASAVLLGAPDLTLVGLSEVADQVRRMTLAADVSVLVDADHGFGNALNARRTVVELEAAGASAMTIEDTQLPQPFATPGTTLVSTAEMMRKLEGAVDARRDPDTVIVARTGAARLAGSGVHDLVSRVRSYAATGVDAIFVAAPTHVDQLAAVRDSVELPLLVAAAPTSWHNQMLASHGVCVVVRDHAPFKAAVAAVHDALQHHAGAIAQPPRLASADEVGVATGRAEYDTAANQFLQ